jgi:uncharacterized protein YqhQ
VSDLAVGGQAVIEGVMIRSPHSIAIAVRQPNQEITIRKREYVSYARRHKLLGLPVVRGGVVLIESMVLGIQALTFSADVAVDQTATTRVTGDQAGRWSGLVMGFTVVLAFALGFGLFFYLPLWFTELLRIQNGVLFNLVDGAFRLVIFLAYIILITQWKEVQRIFAYHGAEHMSIFAFEAGQELTIENARRHGTLHPRCGTSFLLMVVLVSLVVFILLGKPESWDERLVRFLCVPFIGGLSYEFTKLADRYRNPLTDLIIKPGLWLQRFTTQPPDDQQLEVALAAVREAIQ